jgi:hypothetical protein
MKPEERQLFEGFLSKTLNLDAEGISGLFNTEGDLINMDKVLEADASRVAKYKKERTDQYGRGIKDGAEKLENELKSKYKIESELLGVELFDHVLELQTAELNDKLSKKSTKDEDFEKNPKYVQLRKDHEAALKAKEQEWEGKLKEKESEWARKETLSKIAKIAFTELDEGYIMPDNPQRATALKEVMQRELESENYSFLEDETPVILDKEGKPKEDKHGKLLSFKEHVNSIALKYFDKKVADKRGNAGNNGQDKKVDGVFKTKDEFLAASKEAGNDPEKQAAVYAKYRASNLN